MASMGRRSLTKRAWKTMRCFASEVRFLGWVAKRQVKKWNATVLRRQARAAAHFDPLERAEETGCSRAGVG